MVLLASITASLMTNYYNPSLLALAVVLAVIVFTVAMVKRGSNGRPRAKNPFATDCRRPPAPLVTDRSARDRVIKNGFATNKVPETLDAVVVGSGIGGLSVAHGFATNKVPETLDAVVVGSGIGGLSVAAIMAKAGKRVLVLEQHDKAGGCCHTFIDKGFEFNVGLHYVAGMSRTDFKGALMDQLTEGQLQWEKLDDTFDVVHLGAENPKQFPVAANGGFQKTLLERFPEEEKAINTFFLLVKKVQKSMVAYVAVKIAPLWLAKLLVKTGVVNYLTDFFKYTSKSSRQMLNELTDNQDLKAVLAYSYLRLGTPPKDGPFMLQAGMIRNYENGAYYPIGGASEIAFHMIPVIEKAGGAVLVRAPVSQILIDSDGAACGVRVRESSGDVDIHAPIVISDAGLYNTYQSLLPQQVFLKHGLDGLMSKVRHSNAVVNLFVGLRGTKEELGLKAQNCWAFTGNDHDAAVEEYTRGGLANAVKSDAPALFIAFPSARDPTHEQRYPGKSTCVVIAYCPWEWFEKWENEPVMKRGQEYQDLKMALAARIWEQACRLYPQIKDRVEYFNMGTPITNKSYTGAPCGEMHGLDHNMARFQADMLVQLRPETPIPNLYLTGQDASTCGVCGALYGGVFSACAVLNRNVFSDAINLQKMLAKNK